MHRLVVTLLRFGDISKESRIVLWLLVVGLILEVLKVLVHRG